MTLHMEALTDNEVAEAVDQGLASLHARLGDGDEVRAAFPDLGNDDARDLAEAISHAADAWDRVADLLPGFRD